MDLSTQKLPKKYFKAGKECYLDPIRKRLTYITPEETVRQQIISYLIEDLKVPKRLIKSEVPLSHYGIKATGRADIVINKMENDVLVPIGVVECKAPGIFLGKKETDQIVRYANELCCDYLMLSNGQDFFFYHYDEVADQYLSIHEFPVYKKMLNGEFDQAVVEPIPERISFNQLEKFIVENRTYGESSDIGNNTPMDKAVMCLNLWECLLDVKIPMPLGNYKIFNVIEDLGVRLLSYGNASGGFFSGPYRSFLIDFQGENQIISFGMSSYCTWAKQDILKTSLNIAIDTEKVAHHSLQLVIDDNVTSNGNEFLFYHHGRIAVGNIGSGRISELKALIRKYYPSIINKDKIYLGKLKNNKLLQLTDDCVKELIENLISYSLIRDIYRNSVKL